MSPAVTPASIFFLPIPSSPFFVLLPSVQHFTVQVQQYYTWLIPNLAGWETGSCFHLSCQMNKLDNILDRLSAFLAELPHNCPCAPECSVCCSTQSQWEELWRSVEELIPSKAVCFCPVFCWEGFGGWASFICAFRSMDTAALGALLCTQTLPSELVVRDFFFLFSYTVKPELFNG